MTALAAILVAAIALTARAILRAPLGFQTDRGFFYGIPHDEQRDRELAAKRQWSVGGGAFDVHADLIRTNRGNDHA